MKKWFCEHLDGVAEELIDCGIFTGAKKVEPGIWTGEIDTTRICNHDEMPQFIDYGVSSNASRALVYCGKGERCQKMKDENRECVTIQPYVNFAGEVIMGHVIFPGTCISSNMAPESTVEKIDNLLSRELQDVLDRGRGEVRFPEDTQGVAGQSNICVLWTCDATVTMKQWISIKNLSCVNNKLCRYLYYCIFTIHYNCKHALEVFPYTI